MTTAVDPPFFDLILHPCSSFLSSTILRARWMLSRPLETKVLPKWMLIPVIRHLTMGDILLTLPLLLIFFAGYHSTFVIPQVIQGGNIASYAMFGVFLTANKSNNLFTLLLGIPFERLIGYHLLASLTCMVLSAFHVYVAFVYSVDGRRLDEESGDAAEAKESVISFFFEDGHNMAGSVLFLALSLLVIFSVVGKLRRLWFEIWLYSHIFLAIAVCVFSILHGIESIFFVLGWWGLDIVVRYIVMAGCKYRMKAKIQAIRPDVVQLTFDKKFAYNPGQFVQICIPQLSRVQFHPFSISSAPHEEQVTLHVRAIGVWSQKLVELAQKQGEVDIMVEGPYGQLRVDIDNEDRYKLALLVSGGIGVTHCQSVGKYLVNQQKLGREMHRIKFVWAVRNVDLVEDMPPLGGVNGRTEAQADTPRNDAAPDEESQYQRDKQVIETDVYCTPGNSISPASVPFLPFNVHSGRPDLDAILKTLEEVAILNGEYNVAVFGCGPSALMDQLQEACRRHSQSIIDCGGVNFDLHLETFEF
jgi:predicted ferric reductase